MIQKLSVVLFLAVWLPTKAQALVPDRFVTTLGITYASQYLTDGFRVGPAAPVMEFSLKLDIPKTNLSLMYWNALRISRPDNEYDEHDFLLMYNHDFFTGTSYAFNFHTFYDYWFFPNSQSLRDGFGDEIASIQMHGGKVNAGVSMTNLLPIGGSVLIPAYNLYYWIYWAQDRSDLYQGGARHELSLTYTHSLPSYASWIEAAYAGGFASVSYNDGAFGIRPSWTHSVGSLYTGIHAFNSDFVVSANKQLTYQRTLRTPNEFWATVTFMKEF